MTSKLLQGIGICAVLALVGGSIAALLVVDRRLHVTVADEEDAARRGPDPVALIAADVGTLHDDVRVLGEGVGTQLQALHDALESSAGAREADLRAEVALMKQEITALRERVERSEASTAQSRLDVAATLVAIGEGMHTLAAAVSDGAAQAVVLAPIDIPVLPAAAAVEIAAVEPAPALDVASLEEPAVEAPKKGFLSFQIPTRAFVFDQLQRFAIVPSLSRVGFDAKSTLHDFSGVTTAVAGEITTNLARPAEACSGKVTARTESLDTGVDSRDESMREILEPKKFPELRFDWTAFEATNVDEKAQKVAGVAKGKLTIHGIARDVAMPVTVAVDASKRLSIDGQVTILMSDFDMRPPSKLGVISVEDEAEIWIALRARTLGPATVTPR